MPERPRELPPGLRIAADIGGTFTDIACLTPQGRLITRKLPSTPADFAAAVIAGIDALLAAENLPRGEVSAVLHASTVATNAILESKGARTALITTAGFRDVLELRRIRVPRLYEPLYEKPAPLVPRRDRHELQERLDGQGGVVRALDMDEARGLLARIAPDLDAVAICFLHAYANPAHEALLARMIRAEYPRLFVSVSHEVLPEIREYERTSTTVVNAYVGPLVADYLTALRARLAGIGVQARLLMMQSSGGTADARQVIAQPVQVIESGPAAGVVGAARVAAAAGIPDVITFDMGGTTAKASLIEGGAVFSTDEYEVGGGISLSSRLVKGGGYAVKLPVIDVSEVGAGGGSIVRVDASGVLKLGPDSAGATPGPACYGRGGALPTVTDASVVLGYLNPQALAGGTVPIDAAKAWAAYDGLVAPALGCSGLEAAYGVHRVANAVMMRAIKAVSTYRGRDPRDFSLFAFGGNGGIHAVALARELQMRQVVVPAGAGVFSALGLLFADFEVMRSAAFLRPAAGVAPAELNARFAALQLQVEGELGAAQAARILWRAEMRYAGQAFELPVSLPARPLTDLDMEQLRERFAAEHARFYGYRLDGARIDFVALRVLGGVAPILPAMAPAAPLAQPGRARRRQAYFGREIGAVATDILARIDLDQGWRAGPAIIEDEDGTVVVPPGARIRRDAAGNLVIAP